MEVLNDDLLVCQNEVANPKQRNQDTLEGTPNGGFVVKDGVATLVGSQIKESDWKKQYNSTRNNYNRSKVETKKLRHMNDGMAKKLKKLKRLVNEYDNDVNTVISKRISETVEKAEQLEPVRLLLNDTQLRVNKLIGENNLLVNELSIVNTKYDWLLRYHVGLTFITCLWMAYCGNVEFLLILPFVLTELYPKYIDTIWWSSLIGGWAWFACTAGYQTYKHL